VQWGALGVAIAFSVARVILFVPTLIYTCHDSPVAWTSILETAARPAVVSAVAGMTSLAMNAAFSESAWSLIRNGIVFAATYNLLWVIIPGGRALMRENLVLARTLYRNS